MPIAASSVRELAGVSRLGASLRLMQENENIHHHLNSIFTLVQRYRGAGAVPALTRVSKVIAWAETHELPLLGVW